MEKIKKQIDDKLENLKSSLDKTTAELNKYKGDIRMADFKRLLKLNLSGASVPPRNHQLIKMKSLWATCAL